MSFTLIEWLLRTASPYSIPDCSTVREVRGLIPQSTSVSVAGCPPGRCNRAARRLSKASHTCSMAECWPVHSSDSINFQ
ncbi:hypothetical protein TNCV_1216091 [Trichonephila clavipes]|nr:hypothetical protein TNCV_1216091 [Trichonephila clavipes]